MSVPMLLASEEATTPVGPKLIRSKGKIEIMGFEVANVIVRAINLRQSLLERDIEDLRAEVLASEGIRMLVSDDFYHVWCIAAEDKRGELRAVARDVARLGKQCLDPALHSLTQAFDAGAVAIRHVSGAVAIRHVSGAVAIRHVSGAVGVRHVSGAVGVRHVSGAVGVRHVSGAVGVRHVSGAVGVRHVSGAVAVRHVSGGVGRLMYEFDG
ncbi:unnamed protein product [Closterium sp. NIES-53]